MLHSHLVAKTEPLAHEENMVRFLHYRVTVLGDRLFRIEKDKSGVFNDMATQSIWYRNMEKQAFTVNSSARRLTVCTGAVTLVLKQTLESSYIELDGKRLAINNDENLLGTSRTLDAYSGEYHEQGTHMQLKTGVCSRRGVAVVDDTASLRLNDDGALLPPSSDEKDIYVFAYGHDYRGAVKALYMITGFTPMLPRYAMGNWWSRYHRYTDEEYLHLMKQFENRDIPLTVATVDMDWHYSNFVDKEKGISAAGKATEDRGCLIDPAHPARIGWTGYSWNKNLFPDYKAFLAELHRRGYAVTLNLHPRDGVRYYEDMYEEMAKAMGVDPATEQVVPFDIADDTFVNAYFDVLHRPYEKDGVNFWWIDWQQGTKSKMAGLDPLWALNHYHYLDNAKTQVHPLIMSRYAGVGSHRYPIGFSGDTIVNWESLSFLPYFTANSTNIGYTWWGHDIGAHMRGVKDDELFLRYLQFGVFNPINRLHCSNNTLMTREPWGYENGICELACAALRLRHRLIPYLYTCNYLTHAQGAALCEPLYYRNPESDAAYRFRNEYWFGSEMIVAPITRHSEEKGNTAVRVWLPEGTFTDFFTRDVYEVPKGGAVYTMVRPLDSIPVLVKAGGVVPMGLDRGNSVENPKTLCANVYNGNGTFSLFEDKGVAQAFTDFTLTAQNNEQTVTVAMRGDLSVIPEGRTLKLVFPNIEVHPLLYVNTPEHADRRDLVSVSVKKNGDVIAADVDAYGVVEVCIDDLDPSAVYTVSVSYEATDAYERLCRAYFDKLARVQEPVAVRNALRDKVNRAAKNIDSLVAMVMFSDLTALEKQRLIETVVFETE